MPRLRHLQCRIVSGFPPPPRQQSPFSAGGPGISSPPVTAPPARYGSGPPVGGMAPASTGSTMLVGAPPPLPPPTSSSGSSSLSRGYSPAPPASTQSAFSKVIIRRFDLMLTRRRPFSLAFRRCVRRVRNKNRAGTWLRNSIHGILRTKYRNRSLAL